MYAQDKIHTNKIVSTKNSTNQDIPVQSRPNLTLARDLNLIVWKTTGAS